MTDRVRLLVSEGESMRARAEQATLLSHVRGAGPSAMRARARGHMQLGCSAGLDRRERRESARVRFCFSFLKILNSNAICLFH
jgi:hypothetical protein